MRTVELKEDPVGLTMARWVVERGGLVIPAWINKDCEKFPLVKGWQKNGSRDAGVLERWWAERGWASVGVLGGRGSWLVFDCDGSEAVSCFRSLCLGVGGIDWSGALVYRTPGRKDVDGSGGGLHCMWRWPEGLADFHKAEIRRGGWRGGLELRGRGTWTLLPCKRMDGEYEMLNSPAGALDEAPLALVEAFLAEAAQCSVGSGGSDGSDLRELSLEDAFDGRVYVDGRKNAVAGLAWAMSIRGAEYSEVLGTCLRFAAECCSQQLEEGVVQRKVDYTWGRAQAALEKTRKEAEVWMKRQHEKLADIQSRSY